MDNIPTLLFILVKTYWIWDFHDKLESVKTARYFIHFSWFKLLFSKINWKSLKIFFCGGWKIPILYFCIFNKSLLERSHIQTLFSSVFIFCFRIFMSLCLQKRSESSAKRWKSKSVGKRWKSLIYNKKELDRGIPQDILVRSDSMPLTVTSCWRLVRYEVNQSLAIPLRP